MPRPSYGEDGGSGEGAEEARARSASPARSPRPRSPSSPYHKRSAHDAGIKDEEPVAKAARHGGDESSGLDPEVQDKLDALTKSGVVKRGDFDDATLRDLASFSVTDALSLLNQYAAVDVSTVRNPAGFFSGMMARLRRQGVGPRLPQEVQNRLDHLFRSKKLRASDLDERAYDALGELAASHGAQIAADVVDRFGARNHSDIRNLSAFFLSQIRTASVERSALPARRADDRYAPPASDTYGAYRPPPYAGSRYAPPEPAWAGDRHGYPPRGAPSRMHHGEEQALVGVRVHEFHALAASAADVPAPVALRLQVLWDSGNKLVSLLDDRSWDLLAELRAPEGLAAVDETAAAMDRAGGLRNVNAFFMSVASKMANRGSYGGSGGGSRSSLPPYASAGPMGGGSSRPTSFERTGAPALHMATPELRDRIEATIHSKRGSLRPEHFDEGVVRMLGRLSERDAFAVLDELRDGDVTTVRNVSAWIMGMARRYSGAR